MQRSLRALDLNLLLILKTLSDDAHTTRAAAQLGLTQSAVSHALRRLRAYFGDDLFVRTAKGLEATAFTHSLRPELDALGATLERLAAHNVHFDPATSTRAFTIGMIELVSIPFIPRLMKALAGTAPGVVVNFQAIAPKTVSTALEDRSIDLYVGYTMPGVRNLKTQMLYHEEFACVVGKTHKLAKSKRITRDEYTAARHLKLSLQGDQPSYVDNALARVGVVRNHALTLPFYLLGFDVLRHSDILTTMPRALILYALREFFDAGQYRVMPFPFPIDPMPVSQIWHGRAGGDAGHAWLRRTVKTIGEDIERDLRKKL